MAKAKMSAKSKQKGRGAVRSRCGRPTGAEGSGSWGSTSGTTEPRPGPSWTSSTSPIPACSTPRGPGPRLRSPGLPTTFVVGSDGVIAYHFTGIVTERLLRRALEDVLGTER